MPGKKPYEAFGAFVGPLTDALACVARFKPTTSAGGRCDLGKVHILFLTGIAHDGYLRLAGDVRLELFARLHYEIIRDDRKGFGPYRVTTRGYDYAIQMSDGTAVLAYHWHPLSASPERLPHVHIGSTQLRPESVLSKKLHVHTGRITFESVLRDAIGLGVRPLAEDWEKRLETTEAPHLRYRSWG